MKRNHTVAILGAGITGLSMAYALKKNGINCTIYEKENQAGGVIQTSRKDGWLVEKGPNTLLVRKPKIWGLLDELSLTQKILKPPAKAKKRFVVRDGKPCAVPVSVSDFVTTDLFSASAKLRLLKEPFVAAGTSNDESIAHFIRRRLGAEPLDYGVNPFVSGVYAGDPSALSMKHTFSSLFEMERAYGSLAKGFLKRDKPDDAAERALISFEEGLQALPDALYSSISDTVRLNTEITSITRTDTAWNLSVQTPEGNAEREHDVLVSTLPLHQLTDIWSGNKRNEHIAELARVEYVPMSVLAMGFKRAQVRHALDGFGMLVPEREPFSLLGCLFSSTLFERRAPKDHVLLTCFLGGARHPDLAAGSTEALVEQTLPQLHTLLGIEGTPAFHHHTYWKRAIPQYLVGYDRCLTYMEAFEEDNPGIFLAGNFRQGVSVPDCILNGLKKATQIEGYLS